MRQTGNRRNAERASTMRQPRGLGPVKANADHEADPASLDLADPRQPRHPAGVRRLRDVRLGALGRAGAARPSRHGLLVSRPDRRDAGAPAGRATPLRRRAVGQAPRDRHAHGRRRARLPPAPVRRGPPLERGERVRGLPAASARDTGRSQRGWHRATAREVGPRRSDVVRARGAVLARPPERDRVRRPGHRRLLPRALRPRDRRSSPTARPCSSGLRRPTSPATGSTGSSPVGTSSTSAASSPRTRRTSSLRAYASVPGDVPLLIVGDAPYADAYKAELATPRRGRPAGAPAGRALRRGLHGPPARRDGLHPGDVGRRHASCAHRGDGRGQPRPRVRARPRTARSRRARRSSSRRGRADERPDRGRGRPGWPEHERLRAAARARAASTYSWPAIADAYEALFRDMAR